MSLEMERNGRQVVAVENILELFLKDIDYSLNILKYVLNILGLGENIFREGKKRRQVLAVENILKY